MGNNDCVVRTSFYKNYFHPKESYVHSGILNEEVVRIANGEAK